MNETVCECLFFVGEDGFDGTVEEASEFEGEWKAWIKLAGLDCINRLPGDFKSLSEVRLTPVAFGAKDAEAVLHWLFLR